MWRGLRWCTKRWRPPDQSSGHLCGRKAAETRANCGGGPCGPKAADPPVPMQRKHPWSQCRGGPCPKDAGAGGGRKATEAPAGMRRMPWWFRSGGSHCPKRQGPSCPRASVVAKWPRPLPQCSKGHSGPKTAGPQWSQSGGGQRPNATWPLWGAGLRLFETPHAGALEVNMRDSAEATTSMPEEPRWFQHDGGFCSNAVSVEVLAPKGRGPRCSQSSGGPRPNAAEALVPKVPKRQRLGPPPQWDHRGPRRSGTRTFVALGHSRAPATLVRVPPLLWGSQGPHRCGAWASPTLGPPRLPPLWGGGIRRFGTTQTSAALTRARLPLLDHRGPRRFGAGASAELGPLGPLPLWGNGLR